MHNFFVCCPRVWEWLCQCWFGFFVVVVLLPSSHPKIQTIFALSIKRLLWILCGYFSKFFFRFSSEFFLFWAQLNFFRWIFVHACISDLISLPSFTLILFLYKYLVLLISIDVFFSFRSDFYNVLSNAHVPFLFVVSFLFSLLIFFSSFPEE